MKKTLSILLVVALVILIFSGCSSSDTTDFDSKTDENQATETVANPISEFQYSISTSEGKTRVVIDKYIGKKDVVVIPKKIEGHAVSLIGLVAFSGTNVKSVTIPDTVDAIDEKAFSGCKELTEINLGSNIRFIYSRAFFGCEKLKSIKLPKSVLLVDEDAFSNCISMERLTIYSEDIGFGQSSFYKTDLKTIELKEGVKSISGHSAFGRCFNLTEITIPASAKSLTGSLFLNSDIKKATFNGNAPKELDEGFFGKPNKDVKIYYKKGATGFKESHLAKDYTLVEY